MDRKSYRVACYIFTASVCLLLCAKVVTGLTLYWYNFENFFAEIILPLAFAAAICYLLGAISQNLQLALIEGKPEPLTVLLLTAITTLVAGLSYDTDREVIDYNLALFGAFSMAWTPYALRRMNQTCLVIVLQALYFIFLAGQLGYNASAILTLTLTALVIVLSLPRLPWLYKDKSDLGTKRYYALLSLLCLVLSLPFIDATGVMETFLVCARGRPGLFSYDYANSLSAEIFQTAEFFGRSPLLGDSDSFYSNRVFTHILALTGWTGLIPLLLITGAMLLSGIYLAWHDRRPSCHFSAVSMTLIIVQTLSYFLFSMGKDYLFPLFCPFLDGGAFHTTLFLAMAMTVFPFWTLYFGYIPNPEETANEEKEEEEEEILTEEFLFQKYHRLRKFTPHILFPWKSLWKDSREMSPAFRAMIARYVITHFRREKLRKQLPDLLEFSTLWYLDL